MYGDNDKLFENDVDIPLKPSKHSDRGGPGKNTHVQWQIPPSFSFLDDEIRSVSTADNRSRLPSFASSSSIASNLSWLCHSISMDLHVLANANASTNAPASAAPIEVTDNNVLANDTTELPAPEERERTSRTASDSDAMSRSVSMAFSTPEKQQREWLMVTDRGVVPRSASVTISLKNSCSVPDLVERFSPNVVRTRDYFAVNTPLEAICEVSDEESERS